MRERIRVLAEAPCGAARCVHVVREYDLDEKQLYAGVSEVVAGYVKEQGGDPNGVMLVGMDVKFEDSLVIDPTTMNYHGATFGQQATFRIAGPNGELTVAMKVVRETSYRY